MKLSAKMLLPALGLPLLLAACGSASTGSGTIKFDNLKTEYRDAAGNYVACDNVSGGTGNPEQTAVGVYYTVSGTISSVDIGLRGNNSSAYDSNYNKNVSGADLQKIGSGNSYKTVFFADSTTGLLPQAIIIKPNADVAIKTVTTSGNVGSFYAKLTINTGSVSASTTSKSALLPSIPVYSNCTVTGTTADKL